ncbi:MAG TPA: nucleotide disphospho-sugar-binding domain-containing protein [Chthoniobacterales bacterium]
MKIGFISLPVPGHFNPMSTLARQLQARRHEVVLFSLPMVEPLARAANLPFVPFGEREFPKDQTSKTMIEPLSKLKGEEALRYTIGAIAAINQVKWKELPKRLASAGVDALVLDNYDFYGEIVPMRLGLPYATMSNALHFDYSGHTPLCVYGWAHQNTPEARDRNRGGVARFTRMLMRSNAALIAEAENAGIHANWMDPSSLFSDLPWITQCPQEFDFQNAHWPRRLQHTGLFHDGKGRPDHGFPWEKLTGEPLVYISMGTLQNGKAEIFDHIVTAASKHKDLQLVLSLGNVLRPEQIGPVANNTIVVNQAPQFELLKRAALCVTHAGFNTVLEALTHGVPLVALPVTNDQPGVAARIAAKGVGTVAPLDRLDASYLSGLMDEVLYDPSYRDNARSVQDVMAKRNGLSAAADRLEEALGASMMVGAPVHRTTEQAR